jgi:argininosuccinate lyase
MPFREANGVVGDLVRRALDDGRRLSDIDREELASFSELLDDEYYEVLKTESALGSKRSAGGTAPSAVAEQLESARAALAETRA